MATAFKSPDPRHPLTGKRNHARVGQKTKSGPEPRRRLRRKAGRHPGRYLPGPAQPAATADTEALRPTLRLVRQEDEFLETAPLDDLTDVLQAAGNGDEQAEKVLFERVYGELRRLARGRMFREHGQPTLLQTTALVNEAYLRLMGEPAADWQNRRHFFGAAVQAMKRILVDYARKRDAVRRGGGMQKVSLSGQAAAPEPAFEVLDLHDALERLHAVRPRAAQVVEYRFLLGMSVDETAEMLEVSPRTVDSDWRFARAWLQKEMKSS